MAIPTNTPNVVIESPKARRIARGVLDAIGVVLGLAIVVDGASGAFDILEYTTPALAGWTFLRTAFGFGVDQTNTPTPKTQPIIRP